MTIHIINCVKTCQREQGNTFVQHFNMQNTVDQFLNSFILSFYGGGGGVGVLGNWKWKRAGFCLFAQVLSDKLPQRILLVV